ncbi:MAG TPA: hypothetical protein VIP57_06215 [Candidatus Dormibacteraeota bacterium]
MAFVALLGFIFALGLAGRRANRRTYIAIGLAAAAASAWEYLA